MIIRGFVKTFMNVKLDIDGLKKDDDKILFERVKGFIKKQFNNFLILNQSLVIINIIKLLLNQQLRVI